MKSVVWWFGLKQYVKDMPFARRRELKKEILEISAQIKNRETELARLKEIRFQKYRELDRLRKK